MKVICISDDGLRRITIVINPLTHIILPALLLTLVMLVLSLRWWGMPQLKHTPPSLALGSQSVTLLHKGIDQQLTALSSLQKTLSTYHTDIQTLAIRLSTLEAEINRLNTLAKYIVIKVKLDPKEFGLDKPPALGGYSLPSDQISVQKNPATVLLTSLNTTELETSRQRSILDSLNQLFEGQSINSSTESALPPTESGYVSSRFGFRSDPFTGSKRHHQGVDFAGPEGSSIFSIGSGVVSFVGLKGGYGNVVEINHGDGITSRYAHLKLALVQVGTTIQKGDWIALMGTTGRSTGSHLHLEILKDGQAVDPLAFLKIAN